MPSLTLPMAELAGIVVHSTLFGIYCILFVGSLYVFFAKGNGVRRPINRFLLFVDITLFLLIVVHWILQIDRLFEAFIYKAREPGGPAAYYKAAREVKFVVKTAFYVAQMFVGDTTMIYRLYIVWGGDWRIIVLPTITTTALTIAGINVVVSFARQAPGVDIFTSASGHWIVTVFATTLFTNILVTCAPAFDYGLFDHDVDDIDNQQHSSLGVFGPSANDLMTSTDAVPPVIQIVVESALIYTVCLLITHVSYLAKAPFQFIALDATSPAIGIAFALLVVRVGLGRGAENITTAHTTGRRDGPTRTGRSIIRFAPVSETSMGLSTLPAVDLEASKDFNERQ
ncbi:hypothetical protein PC9H_007574 [Pleurotus ostreatus]|uniref:Uncharacterized protein n=1 Tax=Pleurotus ostreatus TaxID=5322 RepID=A0A8H6ZYD9_PLEOS|nr:uncharacterized protein PC9H_007574 [Pleurotus ostreatus]KAF7428352.1 hypothetical protein PC9H_007574 [Pleurotus ostreatus]